MIRHELHLCKGTPAGGCGGVKPRAFIKLLLMAMEEMAYLSEPHRSVNTYTATTAVQR